MSRCVRVPYRAAFSQDVTFNMIFMKDYADYAAMNEIYREYLASERPARYCVRAELLRPGFLVEIASIAHVDQ